jgi:streptogramin lyase
MIKPITKFFAVFLFASLFIALSGCSKSGAPTPANTAINSQQQNLGATTTFAGSDNFGAADGTGAMASFFLPTGIAVDINDNLFIADAGNNAIRKITPAGVVTTFAGSGKVGSLNGTGTAAKFSYPVAVAVDASGNIYVADQGNNLIRKITPAGVVTTFAGSGAAGSANGTGTAATFYDVIGIAVDGNGNVFVSDQGNNLIRKITPAGVATTFAGSGAAGATNGTGTAASFNTPAGLATDAAGNVYVADEFNNLIRKITPSGVVTTVAGSGASGAANGTATASSFNYPSGLAVDAKGNIYVADHSNNLIRKIDANGVVSTLAGTGFFGAADGILTASTFGSPTGVAVSSSGAIFVADNANNMIRKIVTN